MVGKPNFCDDHGYPPNPMILLVTSGVFLLGVVSLLVTARSLSHAPMAYEDDAGFHLGREP
jgi:hypothetical protein